MFGRKSGMCSDCLAKAVMFLGATAALLFANETCLAAQGTGKISVYHLNPQIPGRGACIQMVPALPGTWACVYSNNTNVSTDKNNNTNTNVSITVPNDTLF